MVDLAVIMSVYRKDRLSFLKESVQSILDQTWTEFHFYIIFDGPVPDELEEYILSVEDPRIRLFRLEQNSGLAVAMNRLLEEVLKEPGYRFIARMDADDVSMPLRIEQQVAFLQNNPAISCVGSWYEVIDENGRHLSWQSLPSNHDDLIKRYLTRTPFVHPSVMFRRELVLQAGFYPVNTVLMEDNVLWAKAIKAGLKFSNIPGYLFKFRLDNNFHKRRSGLRYGWNFFKTRIMIGRLLNFRIGYYLGAFFIGLFKCLPGGLVRYYYRERFK